MESYSTRPHTGGTELAFLSWHWIGGLITSCSAVGILNVGGERVGGDEIRTIVFKIHHNSYNLGNGSGHCSYCNKASMQCHV